MLLRTLAGTFAAHSPVMLQPTSSTELLTAFSQLMSSFEALSSDCRAQGIDPMSLVMSMVAGVAPSGDSPPWPTAATPDDTALGDASRALVSALDRGDVATVVQALAPGFIAFRDGAATDRATLLAVIAPRNATGSQVATRTWSDERIVRNDDALVFIGKAHEVQAGNQTKGGYLRVGWYLVQWSRVGDAWRVQLLTWQKEATERDRFNDIFEKDRGFSHAPNQLLIDTVCDEPVGDALDLAMGQGRNALYLASLGWRVTGVDIAEEGVRIASAQAHERGLALDAIHADVDNWDFGENRYDLVTLLYAGDDGRWIDKIKASRRPGGRCVIEGWARSALDGRDGFGEGQLATQFAGYEILRDETQDDVPDWAWDTGTLVRFVARKPAV